MSKLTIGLFSSHAADRGPLLPPEIVVPAVHLTDPVAAALAPEPDANFTPPRARLTPLFARSPRRLRENSKRDQPAVQRQRETVPGHHRPTSAQRL